MTTQEQINSDLIGLQVPIGASYYDQTQVERGKFHGRNFPAVPPTGEAVNAYTDSHYYDLGLTLAIAYARTQDPEFLTLFQKVSDSWWKLPGWIDEGRQRNFDAASPKFAGICGLILRAADRPEMWDWLYSCTNYYRDIWIRRRMDNPDSDFQLREAAFTLQFMAWLARALPDSFPLTAGGSVSNGAARRAQLLADCENAVLNYFGSSSHPHGQKSDGSWRWDDWYYTDPVDGSQLRGITQPFMIGLLLDALIDVYNVTSNESVKASIVSQVTKACRHLYSDGPYTTQFLPALNVRLRGFHYFYHGGTTKDDKRYEHGDLPPDWDPANPGDVQNQRQPIGLLVAAYGWCYDRTKDQFFKDAGDELWDSAYGQTDGIKNYMRGDKGKDYNQNCRSASSYLVWAGEAPIPQPEPLPTTPTQPIPEPVKTPSPDGTKAVTIVDSEGKTWTLGSGKETLREGAWMNRGEGFIYKFVSGAVYVLGTDSNWWKWIGSWSNVGPTEPGTVAPQPAPAPVPQPTPTPVPQPAPRVLRWPTGKAEQATLWQNQAKENFRPNAFVARPAGQPKGDYVEFVRF